VASNPPFLKLSRSFMIGRLGFFVAGVAFHRANIAMGTKTTFICDCCLREADSNLGWARVHINGASGDKQLLPDDDRDLCEICWSPLQVLMKKVHAEARARRSSSSKVQER
jgi:hypothetical protein